MKHKRLTLACLLAIFMVFGMFSTALAYTLSLEATSNGSTPASEFERGDNLFLNIVLDNATDVAGCAFTLNYDSDVLTAPVTTSEGESGDIDSLFPFIFVDEGTDKDTHRENSSVSGEIKFSGAAIDPNDGGGKYKSAVEKVLFTVKFTVRNDAPYGDFSFSLTQTRLTNADAGWDNELVPVLIGAVSDTHGDWGDLTKAFPVLLGDQDNPFSPVTMVVSPGIPDQDSDGDGLMDSVETNTGEYKSPDDTGTDPHNPDTDGDGYSDGVEVDNGTNPHEPHEPGGPGWDPTTDTRIYDISGAVTNYFGCQTPLYVKVYDDAAMSNEVGSTSFVDPDFPQDYAVGATAAWNYYLKAFIDADGNGLADSGEPSSEIEVAIGSDLSGNDIMLSWSIYFDEKRPDGACQKAQVLLNADRTFVLKTEVPDCKVLKAYNIEIDYDASKLELVSYNNLPTFPPTNVNDSTPGTIILNGFNTTGVAGLAEFGLIEFTFRGLELTDSEGTPLSITVNSYGDDAQDEFPPQSECFVVDVVDCLWGDADNSVSVDIFDALMIAEYDAGLITEDQVPCFAAADVDCSGAVDIFDALKIAEFDAGLIPNLDCQ